MQGVNSYAFLIRQATLNSGRPVLRILTSDFFVFLITKVTVSLSLLRGLALLRHDEATPNLMRPIVR